MCTVVQGFSPFLGSFSTISSLCPSLVIFFPAFQHHHLGLRSCRLKRRCLNPNCRSRRWRFPVDGHLLWLLVSMTNMDPVNIFEHSTNLNLGLEHSAEIQMGVKANSTISDMLNVRSSNVRSPSMKGQRSWELFSPPPKSNCVAAVRWSSHRVPGGGRLRLSPQGAGQPLDEIHRWRFWSGLEVHPFTPTQQSGVEFPEALGNGYPVLPGLVGWLVDIPFISIITSLFNPWLNHP